MIPAPVQRRFDLPDARPAPMLSVEALRAALRKHEDDVLYLFEDGQIRWALNIGMPDARKALWRALPAALDDHLKQTAQVADLEAALDLALPHHRTTIRVSELAFHWVCSSQHIYNLAVAGCVALDTAPTSNTTGRITRDSAVRFINENMIV